MFEEVYTAYAEHNDKTLILKDTFDDKGNLYHTEIIGFFYGSPNNELTREYIEDLTNEYK